MVNLIVYSMQFTTFQYCQPERLLSMDEEKFMLGAWFSSCPHLLRVLARTLHSLFSLHRSSNCCIHSLFHCSSLWIGDHHLPMNVSSGSKLKPSSILKQLDVPCDLLAHTTWSQNRTILPNIM